MLRCLGRTPGSGESKFQDKGRKNMPPDNTPPETSPVAGAPPVKLTKDIFEVYQTGELTVVGFGAREILDQLDLTVCRAEIIGLVEKHQCKTLAFDLSGVKLIPSGMLGLLASLRKMNIQVHIYNPSEDVAEVLQITRLSEVLPIHYIDIDAKQA
ncbi:MAG TPA: STAS domain-containing protein [Planctomycetaceae bacterium]